MPFIEMGKDMRSLAIAAQRDPDCGIPGEWLKTINYKSALYAKHQALLISEYQKDNHMQIGLTSRETDVLNDLYNGLSQSEIAVKYNLSVNTVKFTTKNIYKKLNVNTITELMRVAVKNKLV